MSVLIETSEGTIVIDLYVTERPVSSRNFLKLCKIKYYNCSLFHSIQHNLVAQTGDPTGKGKGGKSIYGQLYGEQADYFEAETKPRIKHAKFGTVSMVNNGNDMHGSQFFITLAPDLDYLDGKHTVFGEVAEGFELLYKFNEWFVDKDGRPYRDVRIFHTIILDDPFEDPTGLQIPDRSPIPTPEELDSGRIGVFEKADETEGMTEEEIEEMFKQREAKANAQILEMVGDIPDAEIKPEENVLFVCKLNPVTTSEDLEVIFSRFGKILSCEVIKEQKSGESLQYAFIEFATNEECERAYFKMDNVLIDERRIHVDFSQSVAKLKYKGGGYPRKPTADDRTDPSGKKKNSEQFRPRINRPADREDDRYDMVFDDNDLDESDKDDRKRKERPDRGDDRHKRRDGNHRRKRSRSRSRSGERRRRRRSRSHSRERRHRRH